MRKALLVLLAPLAAAPLAAPSLAAELEVSGHLGTTIPFYSQTFKYDPGPVSVPIPGVTVEQSGDFELKASGGTAFALGVAVYVTDGFGFELRYDHADITVETQSSAYSVRVGYPPPLDPVVTDLDFPPGAVDLKAAAPLSLNLKARTGGRVRLTLSGGASHLGDLELTAVQTVGLGVTLFDLIHDNIQIGTLGVRAMAPAGAGGSWGGNLGLGLQIPIGERAAILLEGRGFYFPKRTVEWEPITDRPLSDIEQDLLDRVLERLPPVEFEPWWVQASVGLAVRF